MLGFCLPPGGGFLCPVGIKKGVKDCVGKYSLVVIQVVICSEFCVDVKLFIRVQVGSFSAVMYHLHNVFYVFLLPTHVKYLLDNRQSSSD